jgi:hypothetical protein
MRDSTSPLPLTTALPPSLPRLRKPFTFAKATKRRIVCASTKCRYQLRPSGSSFWDRSQRSENINKINDPRKALRVPRCPVRRSLTTSKKPQRYQRQKQAKNPVERFATLPGLRWPTSTTESRSGLPSRRRTGVPGIHQAQIRQGDIPARHAAAQRHRGYRFPTRPCST